MNLSLKPISEAYAREIASWQYESPYDIYGHPPSDQEDAIAYLMADENNVFAVIRDGEVIGFRSFGEDGQVPGGKYEEGYLDTGGGLRPDLTGKGMGEEVIRKGLEIGSDYYVADRFRVTVAAFNQRALKVCRRIGFREVQRFRRQVGSEQFAILVLDGNEWSHRVAGRQILPATRFIRLTWKFRRPRG
ncbi:MAG: GNAT family N-acetyltransferase [Opitutales bacterium]|nr:GNAT family N-acetyltransferase [Opitutales bacterium]